MRELTVEEIRSLVIAGGAQSMTKVLVTAPWIPSPTSGSTSFGAGSLGLFTSPGSGPVGGGHGMLAAPVGGGGGGSGFLTQAQMQSLLKGITQDVEAGILKGDIPSNWIEGSVNVANIAKDLMQTNLSEGKNSFQMYQDTGFAPNPEGTEWPINWSNVNWSLFASPNETYQQALEGMYQYVLKKNGGS